jgi:hypothetical protein
MGKSQVTEWYGFFHAMFDDSISMFDCQRVFLGYRGKQTRDCQLINLLASDDFGFLGTSPAVGGSLATSMEISSDI